jgi:hypothetical protein
MTSHQHDVYCQELAELLAKCDVDDPDPDLLVRLEQHMEECNVCEQAEQALNQKVALFREASISDVSDEFECDLVDRLCHKSAG